MIDIFPSVNVPGRFSLAVLDIVEGVLYVRFSLPIKKFLNRFGQPFQDMKDFIVLIWSKSFLELQILNARWKRDFIQAVFCGKGSKLEKWVYSPVCVSLR